ncbi:MAG: hypothetical protein ACKO5K_12620, partial [Armatimonadota bacterium]
MPMNVFTPWIAVLASLALPRPMGARPADAPLVLDPKGTAALRLGYMPVRVALADVKPAGVVREPAYVGKPKYAILKVGNGPRAAHAVALDLPEGGEAKIWVDANGDGDLTNDGDGAWKSRNTENGRTVYGVNEFLVRASYGDAKRERGSADTGIALYRIVTKESDLLLTYRLGVRTGVVDLGGAKLKASLIENDADGLYNKGVGDDDKPLAGQIAAQRPVWLMLEKDGKRLPMIDIRYPFELEGKAWVATASADGSKLTVAPTTRAAKKAPTAPERPPL